MLSPAKSRHAQWYTHMAPAMVPIFLLGSAVYLGLELTQLTLAHQKHIADSSARIHALESEIARLREQRLAETSAKKR